jgi:hypothetical protein
MKYYRRVECGSPEELTFEDFVKGIRSEFMFGKDYYERMFILLGTGMKMIGSIHMYWVEDDLS